MTTDFTIDFVGLLADKYLTIEVCFKGVRLLKFDCESVSGEVKVEFLDDWHLGNNSGGLRFSAVEIISILEEAVGEMKKIRDAGET